MTYQIVNIGRALAELPALHPKHNARFHFELAGSLQGFHAEPLVDGLSPLRLENVSGHSKSGRHSLALHYAHTAPGQPARAATPTFLPPNALTMQGYSLFACPTLYPGQAVTAELAADAGNQSPAVCRIYLRRYSQGDKLERVYGPEAVLMAGERHPFHWRVPETGGWPVAEIGIEINSPQGAPGTVYLDYLTWSGAPDTVFSMPEGGKESAAWRYSWVNAASYFQSWADAYRVIQNQGVGLLIHGAADWEDYRVEADVTPHMAISAGVAARVQGLKRYYALTAGPGRQDAADQGVVRDDQRPGRGGFRLGIWQDLPTQPGGQGRASGRIGGRRARAERRGPGPTLHGRRDRPGMRRRPHRHAGGHRATGVNFVLNHHGVMCR